MHAKWHARAMFTKLTKGAKAALPGIDTTRLIGFACAQEERGCASGVVLYSVLARGKH